MSNTFYETLLRSQNGMMKVKQAVQSGLTNEYSLIYPNKPPTDRQSLRYNASTGFLEWTETPVCDRPYFVGSTVPTNPVDGTLWHEVGTDTVNTIWEWDAANNVWWSDVKIMQFPIPYTEIGNKFSAMCGFVKNTAIRKFIMISAGFTLQVTEANTATNFYNIGIRYFNNLGVITNFLFHISTNFTQPNAAGAIYRDNRDIKSFNVSGNGRIKYLNNVFAFDGYIISGAVTSTPKTMPFGDLFVTYRHERV